MWTYSASNIGYIENLNYWEQRILNHLKELSLPVPSGLSIELGVIGSIPPYGDFVYGSFYASEKEDYLTLSYHGKKITRIITIEHGKIIQDRIVKKMP